MRTKRKLIEKITEILVQSQFQYWVDRDTELTAEKVNSRKQRAIDYYLGITEDLKQLTPHEQVRFHALISFQIGYIANLLNEPGGLVDKLVGALENSASFVNGDFAAGLKSLSNKLSSLDELSISVWKLWLLTKAEEINQALASAKKEREEK